MSVMDKADELTDSWINGNKSWVAKEILKLPKKQIPAVTLYIFDKLYDADNPYNARAFMRSMEALTY